MYYIHSYFVTKQFVDKNYYFNTIAKKKKKGITVLNINRYFSVEKSRWNTPYYVSTIYGQ